MTQKAMENLAKEVVKDAEGEEFKRSVEEDTIERRWWGPQLPQAHAFTNQRWIFWIALYRNLAQWELGGNQRINSLFLYSMYLTCSFVVHST